MARIRADAYLAFACVLFLIVIAVHSATQIVPPSRTLRLPNDTAPLKYRLRIVTDIHRSVYAFSGSVDIEILVRNRTNEIVLHAGASLSDFDVNLTDVESGNLLPDILAGYDSWGSFLKISSNSSQLDLLPGKKYILSITYTGSISNTSSGIYVTQSTNAAGRSVPIAATQFEPTSARLAFPCYDEPAFKAKFTLSVTHGANYSAISNMPIDGEPHLSQDGSMATTDFIETPLMSTYLLAFVVSDYEHKTVEFNGVKQSVYYPPGANDTGLYALKNGIRSLTTLEDYFGIKYPLTKLDHISLTKTFGLAMENWGLITYKMDHLASNASSNPVVLLNGILTQDHEISHQWFGNLVSPKWWTYGWLNEGFATYFSHVLADLKNPTLGVMDYFAGVIATHAYNWKIYRPISKYVETEAEIAAAFDAISYFKTACMVRMFHHAMNKKTFVKGLTIYMTKFQYSVADEYDLYECLQEAANKDEISLFQGDGVVAKMMTTWTHNVGIPVVTVTRNYDKGTVTIRQKSSATNSNELWWIPLNFATASSADFSSTRADYVMPSVEEVTIDLKDFNIELQRDDWLILNKQQQGLYNIIYDDQNWALIVQALNPNLDAIPRLNRAFLFKNIQFGLENYNIAIEPILELMNFSRQEDDMLVWHSAESTISRLQSGLCGTKSFEIFKSFVRDIIEPIFLRTYMEPIESLTPIGVHARLSIYEIACGADLPLCLSTSRKLANEIIYDGKDIDDIRLRDKILIHGLKGIDAKEFEAIWSHLLTLLTHDNANKDNMELIYDIMHALQYVTDPVIIRKMLEYITTSDASGLPYKESISFICLTFISNYFGQSPTLDYLLEGYDTLFVNQSAAWTSAMDHMAPYVGEQDSHKKKFVLLLDQLDSIGLLKSDRGQENVKAHIVNKIGSAVRHRETFFANNDDTIFNWLRRYKLSSGRSGVQIGPKSMFAAYLLPFMFTVI